MAMNVGESDDETIGTINTTPPNTNSNTMPWLSADSATSTAAVMKNLPLRNPSAKYAKASKASASAIENENSPAIVEAMLPP